VLSRATAVFEDELRRQLGTAMIAAIEFSRPRPFVAGTNPRDKHGEDAGDTDPEDTIR
jgi:hypothetical protein